MGLHDLLTLGPPINSSFKFYSGPGGNLKGKYFSTPDFFGQRSAPYPSNSNQPYIRIPMPPLSPGEAYQGTSNQNQQSLIPGNLILPVMGYDALKNKIRYNSKAWGPDFLTRGNLFGLVRASDDVERLTKYFFDFTSKNGNLSGLFFTLKQNLLAFQGDDGVYLPTSTISQAGVNLFGFHLNKQGAVGLVGTPFTPSGIGRDFRRAKNIQGNSPNDNDNNSAGKDLGKNISPASPFPDINTYSSLAPDYQKFNMQERIGFKSGGRRGNIADYTKGKLDLTNTTPESSGSVSVKMGPLDTINAKGVIVTREPLTPEDIPTDLINFRIAILNNKTISNLAEGEGEIQKFQLYFRAYLDEFGDNYNAEWKSTEYVGRAESFYRYSGFKRSINLGFTLAASSKEELLPMYKKLNFLVSSLSPTYSPNGYMMGNLAELTVGDYLHEQTGFIDSIAVSIPENSPYEINIGLDGKPMKDMRQLPMYLTVKMKFTPLHKFRPEIATIEDGNDKRYIALENKEDGSAYDRFKEDEVGEDNIGIYGWSEADGSDWNTPDFYYPPTINVFL